MNASTKNASWIFLILINMAISGWYFAGDTSNYKLDEASLSSTVDNRVSNLQVRQFNSEGQLVQQIKTPMMIHVPNENTNYFTQPRIMIIQDKQEPWHIKAREGTSIQGGKKLTLKHAVRIKQISSKGEQSLFKTEMLDYYPDTKLAETAGAIYYEQPGSIIESVGMRAWLDNKHVQLLSRARGTYAPSHG